MLWPKFNSRIEKGRELVRDLYETMHRTRVRELVQVGFEQEMAERISELHGGGVRNFM